MPHARRRVLPRAVLTTAAAAIAAVPSAAIVAAPASAADARVTTLRGFDAPGPDRYDRVTVLKQGPASAKRVLVLNPGTSAGAEYFRPLGESLVRRLPGWQVWSVERRENRLEDHSVLSRYLRGRATQQETFDYYLGWLGNPDAPARRYTPPTTERTAFARDWGMRVAVEDLRRVVRSARQGGRKVVLGGHSLGATITTAYASWDFGGRAGVRDLDGLVLIDGVSAPGGRATVAETRTALEEVRTGSPFTDIGGTGLPWTAGVLNAVASTAVLRDPDRPSLVQRFPLLPASLRPPRPVTNRGQYGWIVDTDTSPSQFGLVQQNVGRLATSGDPRGWRDGELGTLTRSARVFAGVPGRDGTAWFHPRKLTIDGRAVNGGLRNNAQRLLGLRSTRGREIDVPLYAYGTGFGGDRVPDGARALVERTNLRERDVTIVSRKRTAHIDPVSASPERNDFVRTVVPFLKRVR